MQMLTKICRKSESNLSFSYENSVTEGTNLRPVKAVRRVERFLSLAQIDKLYHELSILLSAQKAAQMCNFGRKYQRYLASMQYKIREDYLG